MKYLQTLYKLLMGGIGGAVGGFTLAQLVDLPKDSKVLIILTSVGAVYHAVKNLVEQYLNKKKAK